MNRAVGELAEFIEEERSSSHSPEDVQSEEVDELCSLADGLLLDSEEAVRSIEPPKPFAAFGSYRQRHGEVENINVKTGMSSEAPAKLGGLYPQTDSAQDASPSGKSSSSPVSIPRSEKMRRKALRPRNWSREAEREEAWERKRDQRLMEEEENRRARTVGRSASDCGLIRSSSGLGGGSSRLRSLTDDDLDELRGCIDLGFGFRNQADPQLWNTLPALELCYQINQQYHNRCSPVSTLEDDGTASEGSASPSWAIASPGDNPQQVKTRLRHWAQAVACSVRQELS